MTTTLYSETDRVQSAVETRKITLPTDCLLLPDVAAGNFGFSSDLKGEFGASAALKQSEGETIN